MNCHAIAKVIKTKPFLIEMSGRRDRWKNKPEGHSFLIVNGIEKVGYLDEHSSLFLLFLENF